jgi:hypothetical protein
MVVPKLTREAIRKPIDTELNKMPNNTPKPAAGLKNSTANRKYINIMIDMLLCLPKILCITIFAEMYIQFTEAKHRISTMLLTIGNPLMNTGGRNKSMPLINGLTMLDKDAYRSFLKGLSGTRYIKCLESSCVSFVTPTRKSPT